VVDVLIVGSGGAALTAALSLKAQGASVLVLGKQEPTNSQTSMAQGGINSVLDLENDSVSGHISDTIKSSRNLSDEVMIAKMCQDAPKAIEWLESIGVPFSRGEDGTVAQRQLGGAGNKRACYSQDYTGLKILHTLYDNILKEDIKLLNNHYLLNLVVDDGITKGAIVLDISTGKIEQIDAKATIIATGGYGSLYHGYTTNAFGSTGDGVASVLRAGGYISDMEFIQFHPTALKSSSILISESARGEGGYLLNAKGERFVDELLPRDVVARAIYEQISLGEEVFLDIRHLGKEKLMELLPQEVHLCKLHEGVDPSTQLIPIKPVAHYSMGGIDVDRSLAVRGIKGCFAVGECSNAKVHGANRLGGNSLLEIISFGKLAGESAYSYAKDIERLEVSDNQLQKDIAHISELFERDTSINFYKKREEIGKLFYDSVGIVRDEISLKDALSKLQSIMERSSHMGIGDKSRRYNRNLIELLEFENSIELGEAVLHSAISRRESRGAHYRDDFKEQRDEEFAKHTLCKRSDNEITISFERSYL